MCAAQHALTISTFVTALQSIVIEGILISSTLYYKMYWLILV